MKDKVIQAARDLGLQVDVRTLDAPTRTVAEAAAAVGCNAPQIAKTLVFVADGDPVLVVASGAHRVDPDLLADVFDVAQIRQASPEGGRGAGPGGGARRRGGLRPAIRSAGSRRWGATCRSPSTRPCSSTTACSPP